MSAPEPQADAALLSRVRDGDEAAMRELYARHAGLVFAVAARIVPTEQAEDIVQEIFFSLWQKPLAFDESKGAFKPWLARVARNRALNETRRHATRSEPLELAAELADDSPLPDEARWLEHRREVLRAAVEALPVPQRRAVSLAFFEDLTHSKVAAVLGAPVGTVKTRIRLGLKRLSALVAALAIGVFLFAAWREHEHRAGTERALRMVTASDVVPLHLSAQPGVPAEAHGSYRARPGVGVAVLTTSQLPATQGARYVGWARHGEVWTSFGPLEVGSDGRSVSVAEDAALAVPPDEVRVTRETRAGGRPEGEAVLEWRGK